MIVYIHITSEGKWKKIIKMLNSNEEIRGRKVFAFMLYELWTCENIVHSKNKNKT